MSCDCFPAQRHGQPRQFGVLPHRRTNEGLDHPRRGEHLPGRGRAIPLHTSQSAGGAGEAHRHWRAAEVRLIDSKQAKATSFFFSCLPRLYPRSWEWKMRGWVSRCVPASGWGRTRHPAQRRYERSAKDRWVQVKWTTQVFNSLGIHKADIGFIPVRFPTSRSPTMWSS